MSNIKRTLEASKQINTVLLFEGFAVGILASLISIGYRLLIQYSENFNDFLIGNAKKDLLSFIIWVVVIIISGLAIAFLIKKEKYIAGSGIPQVEAEVQGHIDQPFLSTMIAKMAAGALAIVGGLSLGREGPSIQLGALAGKGYSKATKRVDFEEHYLMTCGAAAGLSAAFNAPLAGILFALEEVHKNFSPAAIVSVMAASLSGDFISSYVFGLTPIFHFHIIGTLPLHYYYWIILLGIITGLLGVFYNYVVKKTHQFYNILSFLPVHYRVFLPLALAMIFAFTCPYVLGGGHKIVDLINSHPGIQILIIALILKFAFSIFSFCSGAAGGIFFPLLILGCLIGNIYGISVIEIFHVNGSYLNNFIILAMAGYFAAIVRAPLTGIVLIAEMSGTLTQLLPLSLISFVAYIVANAMNNTPIYEYLLHNLLQKEGHDFESRIVQKEIFSFIVQMGSEVDNKQVKDIHFPDHCLLVSLIRGDGEIIPKGHTIFYPGDQVVCMLNSDKQKLDIEELESFFKSKI